MIKCVVKSHEETIIAVRGNPLTVVIKLPDGVCPGRFESAEAFADLIGTLKTKYPENNFQLLPFSYNTTEDGCNPVLESILAVAV